MKLREPRKYANHTKAHRKATNEPGSRGRQSAHSQIDSAHSRHSWNDEVEGTAKYANHAKAHRKATNEPGSRGRQSAHSYSESELIRMSYPALKRLFDIVWASIGLLLLLPVGLLIGLLIKLTGGGPVFYGQTRIGQFGKPFRIWKFRSMLVH